MDNEDVGRTRHGKESLDAFVRKERVANARGCGRSEGPKGFEMPSSQVASGSQPPSVGVVQGSGGLWRKTFSHVFVAEFWPTYCSKDLDWRAIRSGCSNSRSQNNSMHSSTGNHDEFAPDCLCGVKVVARRLTKDGPNKGKKILGL